MIPIKPGCRKPAKNAFARGVRACHGEGAEGQAGFSRLAGQRADYVYETLKTFSTSLRPHGIVMKDEIKAMKPAELRAVAEYVRAR